MKKYFKFVLPLFAGLCFTFALASLFFGVTLTIEPFILSVCSINSFVLFLLLDKQL